MSRQPKLFEPKEEDVKIPEELSETVAIWRAYKRSQFRFTYTPEALAALVERMVEMGPERAMAAVKWSMGGSGHPYKGLFEPPAPARSGGKKQEVYQPYRRMTDEEKHRKTEEFLASLPEDEREALIKECDWK